MCPIITIDNNVLKYILLCHFSLLAFKYIFLFFQMAMLIYVFICIVISSYPSDAYKALVATQMPSKSHSILNGGIVRQLLKDGNEVSLV